MWAAIKDMMLETLVVIAKENFGNRQKRQAQGVTKAKEAGKYRGRPINKKIHDGIDEFFLDDKSNT